MPTETMYIPKEGEKTIEGEDGVKVVVEKTFWQKYVWLLFFHSKAVCFGFGCSCFCYQKFVQ